ALYVFITSFAAQSIALTCGVSGYRNGVDRARAVVDVHPHLPLDRRLVSVRKRYSLCAVALARWDGLSGILFFAGGRIQPSMERDVYRKRRCFRLAIANSHS